MTSVRDHMRRNDRVIAPAQHQNRTGNPPGLRRDILTAALRKPPVPGLRRSSEIVLDADCNVRHRDGAPRDHTHGLFRRGAIAMRREQAVPLSLVHRFWRGGRGSHENEACQTRRVCSRAGERQLASHRVADENVAVEAKIRDERRDHLGHRVHAVGRTEAPKRRSREGRCAGSGQVLDRSPATWIHDRREPAK